jgi:hypothetical protein
MPNTRIVIARGAIDGVNTVFTTGTPYVPGSAAYILNGRIHNQALPRGPDNDYGFVELSPDSGTIQVDNPPVSGDVVQIFFWDRLVTPAPPVQSLTGVVNTKTPLQGVAREPEVTKLTGVVRSGALTGAVRNDQPERLAGVIRSQRIVGVVKQRC